MSSTPFTKGMPAVPDPWGLDWSLPMAEPTLRGTIDPSRQELTQGLPFAVDPLSIDWGVGPAPSPAPVPAQSRPLRGDTVVTRALDRFFFRPMEAGLTEAGRDFVQTAKALWGVPYERPEAPENVQMTTLDELRRDPAAAGEKMMAQAFRFAPTGAAAILGAAAAAPAAGAGAAGGALATFGGATGGAMLATLAQTYGVNLEEAHRANPDDPEAAFQSAIEATAIDTGFAGLSTLASGVNPFGKVLKDLALQTFVTQPAIGIAGSRAHQALYGESPLTLADEYLNMTGPAIVMGGVSTALHPSGMLTPERAAEPWKLPWQRSGEEYHIDPEVAAAIPEEGAPEGHPAERFGSAMQRVKKPVEAWHGSPHDFDEFKIQTNVGRGEGGQMFGEGAYFGEARGVGEEYRRTLGAKAFEDPEARKQFAADNEISDTAATFLVNQYRGGMTSDTAFARMMKDMDEPVNAPFKAQIEADLPKLKDAFDNLKKAGKLYNVNLHIKPDQTLDWDAPLPEQPAAIRKLAEKYAPYHEAELPPLGPRTVLRRAMRDAGDGRPTRDHLAMIIDNDRDLYNTAWKHAEETLPADQVAAMREDEASIGEWILRKYHSYVDQQRFGKITGGDLLEIMQAELRSKSKAADELRKAGIRGIRYLDQNSRAGGVGTRNWVMLHDEDIEIKAKFQRGDAEGTAEPFFYRSERVLRDLKTARATGSQWDATLRNKGVKAEELEDLGISDYLRNASDTTVTRQQIQDLIDLNRADFKEVNYGGAPEPGQLQTYAVLRPDGQVASRWDNAEIAQQRAADIGGTVRPEVMGFDAKPPTRFGDHTLPGGRNYREMVLTLPGAGQEYAAVKDGREISQRFSSFEEAKKWVEQNGYGAARKVGVEPYRSEGHWPGIENPLAHVRISDRTGADGSRLLHIEELQSDIHNEARKAGYKPRELEKLEEAAQRELDIAGAEHDTVKREAARLYRIAREALEAANDRNPTLWRVYDRDMTTVLWEGQKGDTAQDAIKAAREHGVSHQQIVHDRGPLPADEARMVRELQEESSEYSRTRYDAVANRFSRAEAEVRRLDELRKSGVWDAPFKKSWADMMMKRMLRYAAENGYDRIIITPGAVIAKRFSLDRFVSKLQYYKDGDGWILAAHDKAGEPIDHLDGIRVTDRELDGYVGKETAEKIRGLKGTKNHSHGFYDLTGDDLKIEAKGKRDFYDVIIPSFLKKFGAKFGAKIGTEEIQTIDREGKHLVFTDLPRSKDAVQAIVKNDPDFLELPMTTRAQIVDFQNRLEAGQQLNDAMAALGQEAGEYLGGTVVGAGAATTVKVHSFELTPALKRSVLGEGQPLYQRGQVSDGPYADYNLSKRSLTPEERKRHARLLHDVTATLRTMVPGNVKILPVGELLETTKTGEKLRQHAAYFPQSKVGPLIVLALEGPRGFNPRLTGTARHEVVHALKSVGLFKPQEWQALEDAARTQDWIGKHKIRERYKNLAEDDNTTAMLEEAIAEEFSARFGDHYAAHSPLVRKAFQKLSDLLRKLKITAQKLYGKDVTAAEIMEKIESGEIGWRKPQRDADGKPMWQRAPAPDTPEFKRWFGGSAVRNEDGSPRVMYHTTTAAGFDAFKRRQNDIGIHFGTEGQARDRFELKISRDPYGPSLRDVRHATIPVYLKIDKPLRLPDAGAWDADNIAYALVRAKTEGGRPIFTEDEVTQAARRSRTPQGELTAFRDLIKSKGYDGIVYANTGETGGAEPYRKAMDEAKSALFARFPRKTAFSVEDQQTPEYRAHTDAMEAYRKYREENAEDSYIAFHPEQIKSAIGNSGAFDPKAKSFMLQRGDTPDEQAAGTSPEARGLPQRGSLPGRQGVLSTPPERGDETSLVGLPANIKIPGYPDVQAGAFPLGRRVARHYMSTTGRVYEPVRTYRRVDVPRARRIAEEFEKMRHHPDDPLVRRAYRAMVDETLAQWQAVKLTGLQVEFINPDQGDPYYASPRLATEDVRKNNHLWVFATDDGFGTEGITAREMNDNPLLEFAPGETISGRPARMNDIFRIVHDYFGHIKDGVGFRADGEENAWRSHAKMYSPEAMKAMTTETRGQNSWLNYGPHGEKNRTARSEDTVFAEQKIGLLPDWVYTEGLDDDPVVLRAALQRPDDYIAEIKDAWGDFEKTRLLNQKLDADKAIKREDMIAIANAAGVRVSPQSTRKHALTAIIGQSMQAGRDAELHARIKAGLQRPKRFEVEYRRPRRPWTAPQRRDRDDPVQEYLRGPLL